MKFLDRFKRKNNASPSANSPSASPDAPLEPGAVESARVEDPDELRLELGDFLHRIPAQLLHPGPHDLKTDVYFSLADLSQRIARGETTVELLTIYKQVPQIFRSEVRPTDNYQVRFPWQKLAALVKESTASATTSPANATEVLDGLRAGTPEPTPDASLPENQRSHEPDTEGPDKMREELNSARASVARLEREVAELRDGSPLKSLTAERDALIQQKAHLSRQLSDLSRRGQGSSLLSTSAAAQQRQVEEFQRRIALMESAQRDTALELSREKEARAKAEKLLAAADKLQEQSANYMVTARAEIRREVETSFKTREAESRKVQKDLQDQLAALNELYRKACLELEESRALLVAAQDLSAPPDGTASIDRINHLEVELESYREQLETLRRDRDDGGRTGYSTSDASVAESEATHSKHSEELERLKSEHQAATAAGHAEHARLEEKFAQLEKEHAGVIRAKEDLAQRFAESERARRTLEKEYAKAAKSEVGLLGDPTLQAELAIAREQITVLEEELKRARLGKTPDTDDISEERSWILRQRETDEKAALQRELARIQAERDNLLRERDQKPSRGADDRQKQKSGAPEPLQGELLPNNIIEVTEILPPDPEKNLRIPRVRPANVRPPKFRHP